MNAKHRIKRLSCLLLALLHLCAMIPACLAGEASQNWEATILFTHDLHSHFLPQDTAEGGQSGGYARLKTAIDREKAQHPNALLLDGGDFSIGSLIQTLYVDEGAELRTMGALGYDAAALGNHEFDHKGTGFAQMLRSAVTSGDPLPALVCANYKPADSNPNKLDIQRAMAAYGMADYTLLERGGITYGIFGIFGKDADDCAPTSGFTLTDAAQAAQRCVDALKEQGAQVIICLSHSGTSEKQKESEDEQLAKNVSGIDVIVSGHTHSTLPEPIVVNDTYIVSCGPYCSNLGSITLKGTVGDSKKTLEDYRLVPIDDTLADDPAISALVDKWKHQVTSGYLSRYGLTYDQVLTHSDFSLSTPESGVQENNSLGTLVADAFQWAAQNLQDEPYDGLTITVTADGVLRAPLSAGDITTSMAFDVLSMGVGEDGTSGFPLVDVYLTGKELRAAVEVDASVTPIMPAAQLYFSGIEYRFNPHRMFFNRVYSALLAEETAQQGADSSGTAAAHVERTLTEIDNHKLYRVVTGMYSAQMLGTVKSKSMGLLSLVPKDENGNEITDFSSRVLKDRNGNEIKEWYALAAYLKHFGESGVPASYQNPDSCGTKHVSRSWNPLQLLRSPNWITLLTLLFIVIVLALVILILRKAIRRNKNRRYRSSYRG